MTPRILIAIMLLGIGAIIGKLAELWAWHFRQQTIEAEPVVTTTNGSHATVVQR